MRRIFGAGLAIVFGMALAGAGVPASAGSYTLLYSFQGGNDGSGPAGNLVELAGLLYGTTLYGGTGSCYDGCGTVFSLDPDSATERVVYSFRSSTDGDGPDGLINVGGTLYGTTFSGGVHGWGSVFKMDPASGAEQSLDSFRLKRTGALPGAGLTQIFGELYGVTAIGGGYRVGGGTVFSVNLKTSVLRAVHSFQFSTEGFDSEGLVDVAGALYGINENGAPDNDGDVFTLNRKTGAFGIVHTFLGGTDGALPTKLIESGGKLYGTTAYGGDLSACGTGCGTVFELDPATGIEHVLYAFHGAADGYSPNGLIKIGGLLYGTTESGGFGIFNCAKGCGTVFSLNPQDGKKRTLHSFSGAPEDGASPNGGLINVGGTLYGMTASGGTGSCNIDCGTVFAIRP